MYKTNYRTDIVNFLGGAYWRGALISKILLFGGVLIGEGRLLESGRLSDHLRYIYSILQIKEMFLQKKILERKSKKLK